MSTLKLGLRLLFLAIVIAAVSFGLTRWLARPTDEGDPITRMAQEFRLDDTQAAAIRKLHEAYEPVCAVHCAQIREIQTRLKTAAAGSPEAATAQADLHRLEQACATTTTLHLKQIAAAMPPAEGERFLELALPKVAQQSHREPLGLP